MTLAIARQVQAEVLALCLGDSGIELTGPCGPAPWYIEVGAGDDPLGLAAAMVRRHLARPLVVHSTSWRLSRGSVLLTFAAPLDLTSVTAATPVRRVSLARNSATGPPGSITVAQVIEHSLRHLSWLVLDDPVIAAELSGRWATVLREYYPEPFRAWKEERGMELIVRCACGWQAQGTEDEVVAAAAEHGEQLHNMTATREQILATAVPQTNGPAT